LLAKADSAAALRNDKNKAAGQRYFDRVESALSLTALADAVMLESKQCAD